MRLLTQGVLATLIVLKILLGSLFLYWVGLDPLFLEQRAIAAQELKEGPEAKQGPEQRTLGEQTKIIPQEEIDLSFIIARKAELDREAADLAKKKAELIAIQEEIEKKISTLSQLRNEIRAEMTKKKVIEDKKLKHLIKAYTAMKPQKAASLIEKLDLDLAIELLSKMKGDIVGNILSFLDVEKAARISEALLKDQEG